ncbi:MAG: endosialidase [Eubacteriales bacterium]|nr:endosialidase [Eubacteriales bacterium]
MAVVTELIKEENGTLSFGNYELDSKTKLDGFEFKGDKYKIKTFNEITKLEKNGSFVYESVPGTTVHGFKASEDVVEFEVEGTEDSQITLELEASQEYDVAIEERDSGIVKTNLGGKLNLSVELNPGEVSKIVVKKIQ